MPKSIVMIHGMSCSSWCWDSFTSYFEDKGYKCYTPILRHHEVNPLGKPPLELGTTGIRDYIKDLEKFILTLDEKPILMGHSMGGLLVQILLAKGLGIKGVLLAPAPPRGINALSWSALKYFPLFFKTWPFWKKPFRISFKLAVYAFLQRTPGADHKKIYKRLVYESGRAASEISLWMFDQKKSSKVDESKIDLPMLIISGSLDRILPAPVVKKIYRKYHRNAEYKEFKNNTHWLIAEQGWEEVAGYIATWIEDKE